MDASAASAGVLITPSAFRDRHMRTNAPVIVAGLTERWRAATEWRSKHTEASACVTANASACAAALADEWAALAAPAARASATDPAAVRRLLLRAKRVVTASIAPSDEYAAANAAAAAAHSSTPPSFRLPPPPSTPNFARLRQLFATTADGRTHLVSVAQCFGRRDDSERTESDGGSDGECAHAQAPAEAQQPQRQTAADGSCARQPMDSFLRDWEKIAAERADRPGAAVDRRRLRYLKDWHLALSHPHYDAYSTPPHFADDWMNGSMHGDGEAVDDDHSEGLDEASASAAGPGEGYPAASADPLGDDDFRFCYMGPAGTWTPMHTDVYNSYSWSANVVGRKLWLLFAPEWRPFLTQHGGQLISDVLRVDTHDPDELGLSLDLLTRHATRDGATATPAAGAAAAADAGQLRLPACFVWLQQEGETIFVPSGWLHQVHNLDDCVSINHNWMNACNLPNMYAFLVGEWSAALAAVSGFDFDAGPGAAVAVASPVAVASASASAAVAPPPELDDTTLGNGWRVMAANVGISWEQFAHFLRFHRARLQRMRVRALRLDASSSSSSSSAVVPSPGLPAPFTLPLEEVDFSLERIDQVEASMRDDGVDALIARRRRLCEAEADDEAAANANADAADPVEQLEQQLGRAQLGENAADDSDSAVDEDESSEEEFVPRHLRPNEGRKRRARIIRDDSDEVDSEPDEEIEEHAWKHEAVAGAVSPSPSSPSSPAAPPLRSPLLHPSPPLQPPPPLQCTCPVHPALPAAAVSAGRGAKEEEGEEQRDGFVSASTLSYLLRLFFNEVHTAVGLPFVPTASLDIIASYAAPVPPSAESAAAAPSAAAAATAHSSSISSCAASSPPSARRAGRGPFLVVSTHYAHGDTFSESYDDEGALLQAVREYADAAMVRALEAEAEGADEAELKRAIRTLQGMLGRLQAGSAQRTPLVGGTTDAPASAASSAPSARAAVLSPPLTALDVLLELSLDIGDDLIASQLGYGWTMVHECGVDD